MVFHHVLETHIHTSHTPIQPFRVSAENPTLRQCECVASAKGIKRNETNRWEKKTCSRPKNNERNAKIHERFRACRWRWYGLRDKEGRSFGMATMAAAVTEREKKYSQIMDALGFMRKTISSILNVIGIAFLVMFAARITSSRYATFNVRTTIYARRSTRRTMFIRKLNFSTLASTASSPILKRYAVRVIGDSF